MSDLRLKDIVFVPSIQHTGTWFVLKFLQHFIPNIKELTFLLEENIKPGRADVMHVHTYSYLLDQPTLVQIHFPIVWRSDVELRDQFLPPTSQSRPHSLVPYLFLLGRVQSKVLLSKGCGQLP